VDSDDYLALMRMGEELYEQDRDGLKGLTDPEAAAKYREQAAELTRQADAVEDLEPDLASFARELAARVSRSADILDGRAN
jgi:hypothetical protein